MGPQFAHVSISRGPTGAGAEGAEPGAVGGAASDRAPYLEEE
jgi:hypothetical protein